MYTAPYLSEAGAKAAEKCADANPPTLSNDENVLELIPTCPSELTFNWPNDEFATAKSNVIVK